MGKRKKAAKKPTGPKRNEPLATVFPCLFCNHEKSVTVKIDKKSGVGTLNCKVCNQNFQCSINYLSAAVDVYADWVDACDAVAKENENDDSINRIGAPRRSIGGGGAAPHRPAARRAKSDDGDEDLDDLIDDGDVDADDLGYGGGEGVRVDEDDY